MPNEAWIVAFFCFKAMSHQSLSSLDAALSAPQSAWFMGYQKAWDL